MPQYDDDYEDDGNVPDPQQPNEQRDDYHVRVQRSHIRNLEESARTSEENRTRAEAAERELAFARAGVSLDEDNDLATMFRDGYKGELSTDAIRAKAEKVGLLKPAGETTDPTPPTPPDTPLDPGEATLADERRRLATGSVGDEVTPEDPYKEAQGQFDRVIEQGGQEKHALGTAINSLVNAANRGDQRVIINPRARQGIE